MYHDQRARLRDAFLVRNEDARALAALDPVDKIFEQVSIGGPIDLAASIQTHLSKRVGLFVSVLVYSRFTVDDFAFLTSNMSSTVI
jgi:hypothetical protein